MSIVTPGATAQPPLFSKTEFRQALGMFATGVTIVTAASAQGDLVGLTASSFNSVSLAPPLVLWSLSSNASSLDVFRKASHYAIHILRAEQLAMARQFATAGAERFSGVSFTRSASGCPILSDVAAHFECFNRSQYQEGDHVIFVGEVEHCAHQADASPLLYHGGKFYSEHPL